MLIIYIDADSCPVKEETVRVAERHGLDVYVVSNGGIRPIRKPKVHMINVASGADVADDWIAERAELHDIVITADILLANRCLKNNACAINPSGKAFTDDNIGNAVAGRDLSAHLRETGEISGHNPSFTTKQRSQFLQTLEVTIQKIKQQTK